jgi:hypothetical protein
VSRLIDGLIILLSIGAGIYLLSTSSPASDSGLIVIAHGMGAYFVSKGLWMGRSLYMQSEIVDATQKTVMWLAHVHGPKDEQAN